MLQFTLLLHRLHRINIIQRVHSKIPLVINFHIRLFFNRHHKQMFLNSRVHHRSNKSQSVIYRHDFVVIIDTLNNDQCPAISNIFTVHHHDLITTNLVFEHVHSLSTISHQPTTFSVHQIPTTTTTTTTTIAIQTLTTVFHCQLISIRMIRRMKPTISIRIIIGIRPIHDVEQINNEPIKTNINFLCHPTIHVNTVSIIIINDATISIIERIQIDIIEITTEMISI